MINVIRNTGLEEIHNEVYAKKILQKKE